jgi:hypothetical protein
LVFDGVAHPPRGTASSRLSVFIVMEEDRHRF